MMLEKAQGLIAKAGEAFERNDHERAYKLYCEALDILRKAKGSPQVQRLKAKTYRGIVDSLGRGGQWVTALEYADAMIREARSKGDRRGETEAGLMACGILLDHGNWKEGKRRYESAMKLAESTGNRLATAECHYGLAYIDCRMGSNREAKVRIKKALDILEQESPSLLQCRTIIGCGSVADSMGDSPQAVLYFRLAIQKLKAFPPGEDLARAYNSMGEAYMNMEDHASAVREFESCVDVSREVGSRRGELYGLCNIAECHALSGRAERARKVLKEVEGLLQTADEKYISAKLPYLRGVIAHAEKDYEKAVECYVTWADGLKRLGKLPYDMGIAHYRRGLALRDMGKERSATEAFELAKRGFEEADARLYLQRLEGLCKR